MYCRYIITGICRIPGGRMRGCDDKSRPCPTLPKAKACDGDGDGDRLAVKLASDKAGLYILGGILTYGSTRCFALLEDGTDCFSCLAQGGEGGVENGMGNDGTTDVPPLVRADAELDMPQWAVMGIGKMTVILFCHLFYVVPTVSVALPVAAGLAVYRGGLSDAVPWMLACVAWISLAFLPYSPWPFWRKLFRTWYPVFQIRHNLHVKPPEEQLTIVTMHPHGVIPLQGLVWSALCDQWYSKEYGTAAAANVLLRLPLFRHCLGWLSTYGSDRKTLESNLKKNKSLFILPDGIRGIFLAKPGRECAVVRQRMGLIRLAVKYEARLVPCYAFGANEQFTQIAADESSFLGRLSRRLRVSITLFAGSFPYILPIPTMVRAERNNFRAHELCFAESACAVN